MAPVVSPASQEILYCWATRETRVTQFSKIRPCGTTPLDTIQGETGESLNNPSQVKHLRLSALHICPLKLVLLKCPHQAWRDRNPLSPEQRLTVPFYCPLHCRECQLWFPFQEQANQLHSEPTNWTVGGKKKDVGEFLSAALVGAEEGYQIQSSSLRFPLACPDGNREQGMKIFTSLMSWQCGPGHCEQMSWFLPLSLVLWLEDSVTTAQWPITRLSNVSVRKE